MNTDGIIKLKELAKKFSVLYVEDESAIRSEVATYLSKIFKSVVKAKSGEEGLGLFLKGSFDVVITDIKMPGMNGIEMLRKIKKINPRQEMIVVSAYTEVSSFVDSIKVGVAGYIIKPIDYNQINEVIYSSLLKLHKFKENELYHKHLEELVKKRTEEKYALQIEKIENYERSLVSLVQLIENRDTYTAGHSSRVAEYCVKIAKAMGYDKKMRKTLYQAGILHDIGKISTPDSILLKPGKLNDVEYKLIQDHAIVGYHFLSQIPMYVELSEIVKYHHERYDGKGYPYGLKGNDIPMLSHIMIVADAFDAMTTNRIYKKSKSVKEAIDELKSLASRQFHPEVAQVAGVVFNDISMQEDISQIPKNDLEDERFSYYYKDMLTGVYNKNYLEFCIQNQNDEKHHYRYLIGFFLHNFTQYNYSAGWEQGDEMLERFALYLNKYFSDSRVFRIHGDDFAVLSKINVKLSKNFLTGVGFLKACGITFDVSSIDISAEKETAFKELINRLSPQKSDSPDIFAKKQNVVF